MEIDEFLDRELSDLGQEKSVPEESEMEQKVSSGAEALGGIKAVLGKGYIDNAEQPYMQLWQELIQQKLKWNSQIYGQLLSLSKGFSQTLGRVHDEAKRKINQVSDFLARARSMLKEGRKDMALKLYAQMQEIIVSIPNIFFEEKRALQQEIMNFYNELNAAIDGDLIKNVSGQLQQISQMIDSINESMRAGNFDRASFDYLKCVGMYGQIPEGFLQSKNAAGLKLLEIYKTLSIQTEISSLQKQLGAQPMPRPMTAAAMQPMPSVQQTTIKRPILRTAAMAARERAMHKTKIQQRPKAMQKREVPEKERMLRKMIENAKNNIKKGFYNEAWKEVNEALNLDPKSIESKVLAAKIKTLQ